MNKTKRYFLILLMTFVFAGVMTACGKSQSSMEDGMYDLPLSLSGGTGKAYIISPCTLQVKDNEAIVRLVWSSKNYDYMIVDGQKYLNENEGGNSTFTIPLGNTERLSEELTVIADTTAMSVPHEIEYIITFNKTTLGADSTQTQSVFHKQEDLDIGITKQEVPLDYATQFAISIYDDYRLITIGDDRFLVVPKDGLVPDNIPEDIVVLKQPLNMTYLVSSSVYDLLCQLESQDMIGLCGTKKEDWYIESAKDALASGEMVYAGKYSAPDYELILNKGCNLAIENTMIYHIPEVKDKLSELGIPVIVEKSSYESTPLGRLEWIKLYGALYDKEDEALSYFEEEKKIIEGLSISDKCDKTVAIFYVNSSGMINVRRPGDYIVKIVESAGGDYAINDSDDSQENSLSTMNMQMEDFYLSAKDADILIYNSTIDGEIESISDLVSKNELFNDFKAVQNGQVYCTNKNFYQETTGLAEFCQDIYAILHDEERAYSFIKKVL